MSSPRPSHGRVGASRPTSEEGRENPWTIAFTPTRSDPLRSANGGTSSPICSIASPSSAAWCWFSTRSSSSRWPRSPRTSRSPSAPPALGSVWRVLISRMPYAGIAPRSGTRRAMGPFSCRSARTRSCDSCETFPGLHRPPAPRRGSGRGSSSESLRSIPYLSAHGCPARLALAPGLQVSMIRLMTRRLSHPTGKTPAEPTHPPPLALPPASPPLLALPPANLPLLALPPANPPLPALPPAQGDGHHRATLWADGAD